MWAIQQAVQCSARYCSTLYWYFVREYREKWFKVPSLSHWLGHQYYSLGKKWKNKLWFILRENVSHRRSIVEGGDNLFIKFSIKDVEYIWSNPTNYWYILSVMFRHLVWMSILGIIRETWDTPALDVITMLLQNYISNCS